MCRRRETANHVINGCPVSLDQGRYTYRHNSVINYIVNDVDSKCTVYSICQDIWPLEMARSPQICVTVEKPDIVILDNHKNEIHLFELTGPSEHIIEKRHLEKNNKYAHFIQDCTDYKCTVNCFEVSSKGFFTTRNHSTLKTLPKFMNQQTKLSTFKQYISAISLMERTHIPRTSLHPATNKGTNQKGYQTRF